MQNKHHLPIFPPQQSPPRAYRSLFELPCLWIESMNTGPLFQETHHSHLHRTVRTRHHHQNSHNFCCCVLFYAEPLRK
uniref:Uncharacterized protein n=1 Tax=Ciona intestinalis TaxID=7719 RepID=F7ATU2_CIOIN